MDFAQLRQSLLAPRDRHAHKGDMGHVLIVGGELGFSGAIRLAAEAALRVGAGLVSIATRPEHAPFLNANLPEVMCHGIHDSADLSALIGKATVIIAGPGLGQSSWAKGIWSIIQTLSLPMVIDADGLNLLAQSATLGSHTNWVLTPHPGEAGRLLQMPTTAIQANRDAAIQALVKRYGATCVLKGAGSLILSLNTTVITCPFGNPGMATGGMGDVLSGVIGGYIAQGMTLENAAVLGVFIHAQAGDMAAKAGERGMIATDLMPYLRQLSNC